MYIKKEYRRLLYLADKQFTTPTSFKKFISEKEKLHNLVIKSKGNNCFCTCCNHNFVAQTNVNGMIKCPNCKQKLLVKTDRLQNYIFKDNLQLLDKVENTFILRTFELYSSYSYGTIKHSITEFMRTIIDENNANDFVTNQVHNHMGYMYVAHYQPFKNWRGRNYRWAYRDIIGMVCPYNLKRLLKDTQLKYSCVDKYVSKMGYVDFIDLFNNVAHYPSFEFLVKLKLYKLAQCSNKFSKGKNFQEIFGISKDFYSFMKRYNIDYKQLEILRLIKKENIKLINELINFNYLEELSKYVNLEEAYDKVLKKNKYYEREYLDYLEMCVQLEYCMTNKKILYPDDLMKEHNKLVGLIQEIENEANDKLIKQRLTELNKIRYQSKKYIIFPASSVDSLINESKILNHCVKTYSKKYALGKTTIMFLRDLTNQDIPLVTVEVKNNEIVQARAKNNNAPSKEQLRFLDKWQKTVLSKNLINI